MAMGTYRCRPEAERHSAAAATGAVATGVAVTNSSLPVDLVLRSSTGIPLTGTIRTATTAIKGTATATAIKGTATTATATKGTATATAIKDIATATAIKGTATTATATKDIATATNGRSKKGKYVSEADAIKQGDKPPPEEKEQDANSRMEMSSTPAQDVYEIRPRNDRDGFDLIGDRLRRGPIWYAGPDAVRNAVSFAKYTSRSRSRWAMIRVFDEAGNVTEAHEQ